MTPADNKQGNEQKISPVAVEKALKGISYPATKDQLVQQAQSNHASNEVVQFIQHLPGDNVPSTKDVMRALGQALGNVRRKASTSAAGSPPNSA